MHRAGLVDTVRKGLLPSVERQFTATMPAFVRPNFDIVVPPKWAAAVPLEIRERFGEQVVQRRPDTYLQAFVHPSFARDAVATSMLQLSPVGKSVLRLVVLELVASVKSHGATIGVTAAWDAVTNDEVMSALLANVWKLDSLVLTDNSVRGLQTAVTRSQRAEDSTRLAIPSDIAVHCVNAIVAAAYINGGIVVAQDFALRHVIRPTLILSRAL